MNFVHLHVHSHFSFKDSTIDVEELCQYASQLGFTHVAITDHNNLCGAIRFYVAAQKHKITPIIGVEITMVDGYHLTLLAKNLKGYSNLCRLITDMHLKNPYGRPVCQYDILEKYSDHLIGLSGCRRSIIYALLKSGALKGALNKGHYFSNLFGRNNFYIELQNLCTSTCLDDIQLLCDFANRLGLPVVATNNVHYLTKEAYKARDVLVCMSHNIPLEQPHPQRHNNDECYLKSAKQMHHLFSLYPQALTNTLNIASRCHLTLPLGQYHFPYFELPAGHSAPSYLRKLCQEKVALAYTPNQNSQALQRLDHELQIIGKLGFAEYFLVVWDIVNFAQQKGIRFSGRGSAAGSIVAYLLNITQVCPLSHNLLFERFLNPERRGMPDIDIDFDSARRDEVIDYLYRKYETDKIATVCTVNTISARSALREVSKAMGFSAKEISSITKNIPRTRARNIRTAMNNLPELAHKPTTKPWESLLDICEAIDGSPRHLSVHLGGVVISALTLTDLVPLQHSAKGVVITQYDKDDIEALGLIKMDILGLRILSVIDQVAKYANIDIDGIPLNDAKTYALLRSTQTVGLFQLESPGMRGLLGRLLPVEFTDIIANVSLFRPGPMHAQMIKPFVERRHGREPVTFEHPDLTPILRETYGVIVYQEQVLQIAHTVAGFTLGQADLLRRAMTHGQSLEESQRIEHIFLEGAKQRNVDLKTAQKIYTQIAAFAAYGFNKAHAASFGWLAYQTAYLKAHHPALFLVTILNNQPMGFYHPRVIVNEARRLGIDVLLPNILLSNDTCTLEAGAIRIGLSYISHLSKHAIASIISARNIHPFTSCRDFIVRTKVPLAQIDTLIAIGAMDSLGSKPALLEAYDRFMANNKATSKSSKQLGLPFKTPPQELALASHTSVAERIALELTHLGCSISAHPLCFFKNAIPSYVLKSNQLCATPNGHTVWIAGTLVSKQTPPTRSGQRIIFLTLEDETGMLDVVIFPHTQRQKNHAHLAMNAIALLIEGTLQHQGNSITIVAQKLYRLTR